MSSSDGGAGWGGGQAVHGRFRSGELDAEHISELQRARHIAIIGVGAASVEDALVVAILECLESSGRQAEAAATLNASTSAWRAGQRGWTDETRRSFEVGADAYLRLVDAVIAAVRPELRP